jgi:uncharacterized protein YpmS
MANWTSPRLRDDVSPPPSRRRASRDQDELENKWRRRFLWILSAAVAASILLLTQLILRDRDVNTVASNANKELRELQAERDDLKRKLTSALDENRRLKLQLDRAKIDALRNP